MKGTEKQIEYATDIIARKIANIKLASQAMDEVKRGIYENNGAIGAFWGNIKLDKTIPPLDVDSVIAYLNSLDDAKYIIDNKDVRTSKMYADHIGFKPEIDEDEFFY